MARVRSQGSGEASTSPDFRKGVRVGLFAFIGVYIVVSLIFLYKIFSPPVPGNFEGPVKFIQDSFLSFKFAHIGSTHSLILEKTTAYGVSDLIFYLTPPLILGFSGYTHTKRSSKMETKQESFVEGASIVVGYFIPSFLILVYLNIEFSLLIFPTRPVIVVGIVYPIVFGGLGGVWANWKSKKSETGYGSVSQARYSDADTSSKKRYATTSSHEGYSTSGSENEYSDSRKSPESGQTSSPPSSYISSKPARFEETLSMRRKKISAAILVVFLLVPTAGASAVVVSESPEDLTLVFLADSIVLAIFLVVYRRMKQKIDLRITDDGVEIQRSINPIFGPKGVFVPFEEIENVQYSEGSPPLHVTVKDRRENYRSMRQADSFITWNTREHRPQNYMVNKERYSSGGTYKTGIRIERKDKPPVYVGSGKPAELANLIVGKSPNVENPEYFQPK